MTYDTFLFFNELALLRLRLTELWDVVDRFVLVESPISHRGHPKPLFFSDNKSQFDQWLDKIDVVIVDTSRIVGDNVHCNGLREREARLALDRYKFPDGSTIVYGDADEIVKPDIIRASRNIQFLNWCEMKFYHYFFNCLESPTPPGARPVIAPYRQVKQMGFEQIRWTHGYSPVTKAPMIPNAGWHFSYLGDANELRYKIACAVEGSSSDWISKESNETIQHRINAGKQYDGSTQFQFVPIDETFPKYVRDHEKELTERGLIRPT